MQAWLKASARERAAARRVARGGTLTLELPAELVKLLAKHADTLGISIDAPVYSTQLLGGLLTPAPHQLRAAQQQQPGESVRDRGGYDGQSLRKTLGVKSTDVGRGVGVAIIDSGIAPTPDLAGRITAFYDFTGDGAPVATTPTDGYGHGTHIAGLIAGSGEQSNGKYVGVATAARLIGLKVLDAQGGGYSSDVIEAVEFATENKAALGIDVINMSLGHPILRAGRDRPAGPGGRARHARRHRRRGLGRQHRHEPHHRPDRLRRHHLARQRAVGADGRLAPAPRRRRRAATTRSRRSARAGRRGSTAAASRTSSRPARRSSPPAERTSTLGAHARPTRSTRRATSS